LHDNQSVVSVKNLYPNPAQDYMTLEFTNRISGHVTVEITNLVGQVMSTEYNGTLGEGDHKVAIRTNELSNGVYMMTVKTADGEATQKFVVAK
jgi:aminopeptidase YwaD